MRELLAYNHPSCFMQAPHCAAGTTLALSCSGLPGEQEAAKSEEAASAPDGTCTLQLSKAVSHSLGKPLGQLCLPLTNIYHGHHHHSSAGPTLLPKLLNTSLQLTLLAAGKPLGSASLDLLEFAAGRDSVEVSSLLLRAVMPPDAIPDALQLAADASLSVKASACTL